VTGEETKSFFRFGVFEVDLSAGELRRQGLRIRLQNQPFQILAMLVQRPGDIVTREELRDRIWPAEVFVDYDKSLSKAVNKVREALGDSPDNSRFIETLARRGYRFLVPVEVVHTPKLAAPGSLSPPAQKPPAPLAQRRQKQWAFWSVMATLVSTMLIGVGVWMWGKQRIQGAGESALIAVPLTTYPGWQVHPSFSPDGGHVVFAWTGPKQDNFDLYVKTDGSENLVRLTHDPAPDNYPSWSPDGRYVAFLRHLSPGRAAVMMIPAFGGPPERKLAEISMVVENPKFGAADPGLSWSPDGKWIVTSTRGPGEAQQSLYLLSTEGEEQRRLTSPPPTSGDGAPVSSLRMAEAWLSAGH
jgi:DNA-binding winged helix-turn-helix (wHTH) protein